jgi:hypothetical protein
VDGLRKIDNAAMDSIEPFNLSEAEDFNVAYLSGFLAERFDETADECKPRAVKRVEGSMRHFCAADVDPGLTLGGFRDFCEIQNIETEYYMLPAWLLHCEYKDKYYLFAMNGQTGKFIGNLPIDWGKLAAITGAVATAAGVIFSFFN